ncbi:hypothetical protein BaRGS_00035695, partial [Batillaria attramentaria]
ELRPTVPGYVSGAVGTKPSALHDVFAAVLDGSNGSLVVSRAPVVGYERRVGRSAVVLDWFWHLHLEIVCLSTPYRLTTLLVVTGLLSAAQRRQAFRFQQFVAYGCEWIVKNCKQRQRHLVRVEKVASTAGCLVCGVITQNPDSVTLPDVVPCGWEPAVVISHVAIWNHGPQRRTDVGKQLRGLQTGRRAGLLLDTAGLHLYIDGVEQGIVVNSVKQPCYVFFECYYGYEKSHLSTNDRGREGSKHETGGGEGIEVLVNEPFSPDTPEYLPDEPLIAGGKLYEEGNHTHKVYHFKSKVPGFVRLLAPKGSLQMEHKAWNAYPYIRSIVTNPKYMKDDFFIIIESFHAADTGHQENVHQLTEEELRRREVYHIDIADNSAVSRHDYKEEADPTLFHSEKTGRGPLPRDTSVHGQPGGWTKTHDPVMCCYKLVRAHFKWWGLQDKVEKFIIKQEKRLFNTFHRQVFCWMDKWYGLTTEDVRRFEEETKHELDEQRNKGSVRGMKLSERH